MLFRIHMVDLQLLSGNLFSDKMIVYFNVFRSGIKYWVCCELHDARVVIVYCWGLGVGYFEFLEYCL